MYLLKSKKYLVVFAFVAVVAGIVMIVSIMQSNKQIISENEVRFQLEQMYDAKVAGVSMKKDVYKVVITKSETVYLVEMNAITGDVKSLEQLAQFAIEEEDGSEVVIDFPKERPIKSEEKPLPDTILDLRRPKIIEEIKSPTEGTSEDTSKSVLETAVASEKAFIKSVKSATSILEVKDDKPMKDIIKDAIKDVLNSESTKVEEKKESIKEETIKNDVAKVDPAKTEPAKSESVKTESTKSEEPKKEEPKKEESKKEEIKKEETKKEEVQLTTSSENPPQSEMKKPEAETKPEKPVTVLITEEQAIKTAQQQHKGTVESSSFVKTNEGGYYLIVMKTETDSKESTKEKNSKATIQVHAISGKILSVTWE